MHNHDKSGVMGLEKIDGDIFKGLKNCLKRFENMNCWKRGK